MKAKRKAQYYLRAAMIASALLLPAVSLIPLGSLWLWEKGYLLYWVGAALVLSVSSLLIQLWMVRAPISASPDVAPSQSSETHDQAWTPREAEAWTAVEALAAEAEPSKLTSRDAVVDLGLETIETVARRFYPHDDDPLWRFTVPEALTLMERVSKQLRPFVVDNIPLGDQLTIAQVIKIYRWRSVVDVAEKAYDVWRIIRLLNPVAAVTNEARERLTKKLYTGVRDELAKRLMQGYVREVGRAAIELYSGRLRVSTEQLASHVSEATERDRSTPDSAEPLRFLVAGQVGVGKSSLINALLRDVRSAVDVRPATEGFTAYELKHDPLPPVLLIDSPGIRAEAASIDRLSGEAGNCDLIVWVATANRADRAEDRQALDAIRAFFASRPERRPPPIILVVTHVDLLRPFSEWSPPYDIENPSSEKAASIRTALDRISVDLDIPLDRVVPVSLGDNRPKYNIEVVWALITATVPEAIRAQLVRRLRGSDAVWSWRKLLSQAVGAGRVAARVFSRS